MQGYPYIGSIGIELECGVPNRKREAFIDWAQEKYGRRFQVNADGTAGSGGMNGYTDGYEYNLWADNIEEILEYLDKAYDTYKVKAGGDSGFHVHIKPNPDQLDYDYVKAAIFHKKYQDLFVDDYKRHFARSKRFLDRLHGNWSKYEYNKENARNTLMGAGDRYSFINLKSTAEPQGTIEIRGLPYQTDAEQAKKSVTWMAQEWNMLFKKMKDEEEQLEEEKIPITQSSDAFSQEDIRDLERKGIKVKMG